MAIFCRQLRYSELYAWHDVNSKASVSVREWQFDVGYRTTSGEYGVVGGRSVLATRSY